MQSLSNLQAHLQPPQPQMVVNKAKKQWRRLPWLTTTLLLGAGAIGIALLISTVFLQSYRVQGPSMQPTLHNQQRLWVWKFPFVWAKLTHSTLLPKRGDIVVLNEPGVVESSGSAPKLVKRVIGLPGERIQIKGSVVTIYSPEHPDGYNPDLHLPYSEQINLKVTIPQNANQIIGAGQVFVMGDNRDNSVDSRLFGPLNISAISGRAIVKQPTGTE